MTKQRPVGNLGDDGPVLADARSLPWHKLGEGIEIKVLRLSRTTGEWALYVRMQPGSKIAPHKHLSAGEFFVTKNELLYDVGSAPAGTYGYEALGEIHSQARADVETEYLFLGRGPVLFSGPDGQLEFVLDWEFYQQLARGSSMPSVTEGTQDHAA